MARKGRKRRTAIEVSRLDQRLAILREPETDARPASLSPGAVTSAVPSAEAAAPERPHGLHDVAEAEVVIVRRERASPRLREPVPAEPPRMPGRSSAEPSRGPPPASRAEDAPHPLGAVAEAEVVIIRRPLPGRPS